MGVSALFLSTGLVAFLIAGYRGVLRARGQRKPSELPLIVIATALGLAFVFLAPVTQALESELVPSLGRLLSNVCTLVAAFGCLHLMLYVSHPAEQVPAKVRVRLITLSPPARSSRPSPPNSAWGDRQVRLDVPVDPLIGHRIRPPATRLAHEFFQPTDRIRKQRHEPVAAVALRELNRHRLSRRGQIQIASSRAVDTAVISTSDRLLEATTRVQLRARHLRPRGALDVYMLCGEDYRICVCIYMLRWEHPPTSWTEEGRRRVGEWTDPARRAIRRSAEDR